jgi:hypothetical protein
VRREERRGGAVNSCHNCCTNDLSYFREGTDCEQGEWRSASTPAKRRIEVIHEKGRPIPRLLQLLHSPVANVISEPKAEMGWEAPGVRSKTGNIHSFSVEKPAVKR